MSFLVVELNDGAFPAHFELAAFVLALEVAQVLNHISHSGVLFARSAAFMFCQRIALGDRHELIDVLAFLVRVVYYLLENLVLAHVALSHQLVEDLN